jgi:hypothetical protein
MLEDGQSEGDYSDQDSPRRRGGDDESNGSLTPSGSSQSESEPEGDYSDEEDTEGYTETVSSLPILRQPTALQLVMSRIA